MTTRSNVLRKSAVRLVWETKFIFQPWFTSASASAMLWRRRPPAICPPTPTSDGGHLAWPSRSWPVVRVDFWTRNGNSSGLQKRRMPSPAFARSDAHPHRIRADATFWSEVRFQKDFSSTIVIALSLIFSWKPLANMKRMRNLGT